MQRCEHRVATLDAILTKLKGDVAAPRGASDQTKSALDREAHERYDAQSGLPRRVDLAATP
jgi:hypothetical protein